jgi:hypothetical protein
MANTLYIIPFVPLEEMRKTPTAEKVKARALTPNLESIGLCYLDKHGVEHCDGFSMAEAILGHEVFSVVLDISPLRWRAIRTSFFGIAIIF